MGTLPKQFDPPHYWWFFARYIEDMNIVHIVIADVGKGIPSSIREDCEDIWNYKFISKIVSIKGWKEMRDSVMKRHLYKDYQLMELAFEYGETRHPDGQGRGKGLFEIREKAKELNADLRVFSGKGYLKLDGKNNKIRVYELEKKINGTILEIAIPC